MAVILFRYHKYKFESDINVNLEKIKKFDDFDEISEYAVDAVAWANEIGLLYGETETTLNPKNSATRAQLAAILMRYMQAVTE